MLVGDPCQLPPLIKSRDAKKQGAAVSLMERLAKKHPASLKQLTRQYRFNQDLTDLANYLSYEGKMEADVTVAQSTLFDQFKNWNIRNISESWLAKAINPKKSICFLDTAGLY